MFRPDPTFFEAARFRAVLVKLAFAFLYSISVGQLLIQLNALPALRLSQVVLPLLALGLLALMTWQRYSLLAAAGLGLLTGMFLWLARESVQEAWLSREAELVEWGNWAFAWLSGDRQPQPAWENSLALLICLSVVLLSYLFIARFNLPFPAAVSLLVIVLLFEQPLASGRWFWILLAGTSVLAALARKQRRSWRLFTENRYKAQGHLMLQAVPAALASLIIAGLLMSFLPVGLLHSRRLESAIDDFTRQFSGPFSGSRTSYTYSIGEAGYYPLLDRLGGPVQLSTEPVLEVSGYADAFLLRGLIAQDYDGERWYTDYHDTQFRFGSPAFAEEQAIVFDLDLPDLSRLPLEYEALLEPVNYSLKPVNRQLQTVFLGGRPLQLILQEDPSYAFFFNRSGQMYSRTWLTPEQTVLIETERYRTGEPEFSQAVRSHSGMPLPNLFMRYLQMPALNEYEEDGSLALLSEQITQGIEEPYDQVLALKEYLMQFPYSLDVSIPPEGVEFVSWFLESGSGYCVYYATALTMLSRLQGIPARYVEGFYVPPTTHPEGTRVVTGQYAHAWTEVYLSGMGWVIVDPTPGGITTEPVRDPDPITEPTPSQGVLPDLSPSPQPDEFRPDIKPDETPSLRTRYQIQPQHLLIVFLLLLLLAYLIRVVTVYRRRHDPKWLAERIPDPAIRVRWYRRELARLLGWLKLGQKKGETVRVWMQRLSRDSDWFAGRESLVSTMTDGLEVAIYDIHPPSSMQLQALAQTYDLLEAIVRQNSLPAIYFLRRVLLPDRLHWPFRKAR